MVSEQRQLDIIFNIISKGTLEPVNKQINAVQTSLANLSKPTSKRLSTIYPKDATTNLLSSRLKEKGLDTSRGGMRKLEAIRNASTVGLQDTKREYGLMTKVDKMYQGTEHSLMKYDKAQASAMKRTSRFKFHWLGLMFAGMALQRTFSGMVKESRVYTREMKDMNREVGRALDKSWFFTNAIKAQANIMKIIPAEITGFIYVAGGWLATIGQMMLAISSFKTYLILNNIHLALMGKQLQTTSLWMGVYNNTIGWAVIKLKALFGISSATGSSMLFLGLSSKVAAAGTWLLSGAMTVLNTVLRLSPLFMIVGIIAVLSGVAGDAQGPVLALSAAMGVLTLVLYGGLPVWALLAVVIGGIALVVGALTGAFDGLGKSVGGMGKTIGNTFSKAKKDTYDYVKTSADWLNWLGLQKDAADKEMSKEEELGLPYEQLSREAQLLLELPEELRDKYRGAKIEVIEAAVWNYQMTQIDNMSNILDTLQNMLDQDYRLGNIGYEDYTNWTNVVESARSKLDELRQQLIDTKQPILPLNEALGSIQTELSTEYPESAYLHGVVTLLEEAKTKTIDFDKTIQPVIASINRFFLDNANPDIFKDTLSPEKIKAKNLEDVLTLGRSVASLDFGGMAGALVRIAQRTEAAKNIYSDAKDVATSFVRLDFSSMFNSLGRLTWDVRTLSEVHQVTLNSRFVELGRVGVRAFQDIDDAIVDMSKSMRKAEDDAMGLIATLGSAAGFMANPGGGIANMLLGVLGFKQSGGPIDKTGLYGLHKGEFVLSEEMLRKGIPTTTTIKRPGASSGNVEYNEINLNLNDVEIQNPMDVHSVMDEFERRLRTRSLSIG